MNDNSHDYHEEIITLFLLCFIETVSFTGCFSDNPNDSPSGTTRLFSYIYTENGIYDLTFMSNDVCILICLERGNLYAGTQVRIVILFRQFTMLN